MAGTTKKTTAKKTAVKKGAKVPADRQPKKAAPRKTTSAPPEISTAKSFKKSRGGVLELPSGHAVRARRIGLETFLEQGDVPNPLIPIVEEALEKGRGADPRALMNADAENTIDMKMVNDMLLMMNNVVCKAVTEPTIHNVPLDDEGNKIPIGYRGDDEDETVYVDEIDYEDKMFIYQWVMGGTDDIATFRKEAEEGLAALA